jgi:hypothetical protein
MLEEPAADEENGVRGRLIGVERRISDRGDVSDWRGRRGFAVTGPSA